MKTPEYAIDSKKFNRFMDRVQKEANRLFPDGEGGSHVEVRLRDCTREMGTDGLPVAHSHNIQTDAEWREAIGCLSVNVGSAARKLDVYIRLCHDAQMAREGLRALQDELVAFATDSGIDVNLGNKNPPPDGMRWERPFGQFPAKNDAMVQIKSLFSYGDAARKELLAWTKGLIERWRNENLPPAATTFMMPPFQLIINEDIAHLYVAVPVKGSKKAT